MSMKTKKHVLKAAKDAVYQKYVEQIENLYDQIDKVYNAEGHVDSVQNLSHSPEEDCSICEKVDQMRLQMQQVESDWHEWTIRSKKNKRKIGKRVEWTSDREQTAKRSVNVDALEELRKSRRSQSMSNVKIAWLHEGALVTPRNNNEMMIVTQIRGNSVEVLHQGTTRWYRNLSLRPADWSSED